MRVNIKELQQKSGLNQKRFSKASGINRYSLSLANTDPSKEFIRIPDDKYYELYKKFPNIVDLPDDFFYYTRLSLLLNKSVYRITAGQLRETIPSSSLYISGPFLYQYKDKFKMVFPELYIPCVENNKKIAFYREADTLPFKPEHVPEKPEKFILSTKESITGTESKRKEKQLLFDKYSVENIMANIDCRMLNIKQFSEVIGADVLKMRKLLKKENCSLMEHADYWDCLFQPYIIPVMLKDL